MATVELDYDSSTGHASLRLNRPDKHNGMNLDMLDAVTAAARRMAGDRALRSVVISGNGPSFCAGLDFASVMAHPVRALPAVAQLWLPWMNRFQRWSLAWRDVGAPVIAAVHGNCFGAGLQLALGADIRVAAPDARFSVMEARWGLVPDMGGALLMRELLRLDVAKELTLSARVIDGREALALGLVTHLSDDPQAYAHTLARAMSVHSPDAVAAGKFLLQNAWRAGDRAAGAEERSWQRRLIGRLNQRISIARQQRRPEKGAAAESQNEKSPPSFAKRRIKR